MAKGDQSVPVPDLPSFFGNAKESARQAEKELKRLQATMRQAVREGKQLEPQLIRRVNELEGIKQRAQEITQQVKDVKRLDKQAKVLASIYTAQRIKELLSGNQGVAAIAGQIVTDPQVLEKASRVLAKSMPKFAGALGNVAPYASIAGTVTNLVFDHLINKEVERKKMADALGASLDIAKALDVDPAIAQGLRDKSLLDVLVERKRTGKASSGDEFEQDVVRTGAKAIAALGKGRGLFRELTGLNEDQLNSIISEQTGKESGDISEADRLRIMDQILSARGPMQLAEDVGRADATRRDEMIDARRRELAETPTQKYQKRETERQLEIMFQRRRSRVPDVVYD